MLYKMPRVVSDQRAAFDSNEFFQRLSCESEIKYVGYNDRELNERRLRFSNSCQAGKAEIAFINSGTNFAVQFYPPNIENTQGIPPSKEYVNFDREPGKVHFKAPLILNGVCVCLRGWISLQGLDGMGCIEFDEEGSLNEASRSSSQQLNKPMPKPQTLKHPSSSGNADQIDKRPRLH